MTRATGSQLRKQTAWSLNELTMDLKWCVFIEFTDLIKPTKHDKSCDLNSSETLYKLHPCWILSQTDRQTNGAQTHPRFSHHCLCRGSFCEPIVPSPATKQQSHHCSNILHMALFLPFFFPTEEKHYMLTLCVCVWQTVVRQRSFF